MDTQIGLDGVFAHKDFQDADIDAQLGYIDKWYAKRSEGEDEQTRQGLEFNKSLVRGSHEMKWMEKNDTPPRQEFATSMIGAYKGLYDASKNPELTKIDRAKAIIDFKNKSEEAEGNLTKFFNRQSTVANNAASIQSERLSAAKMKGPAAEAALANGFDQNKFLGAFKEPSGSPTEQRFLDAGVSQEDIDHGLMDGARMAGKNPQPIDSHYDQLSTGEVVFTPQGLVFPDEARKRLESSDLPGGAKRRALSRLETESSAHNQDLYSEMQKSGTLRSRLNEMTTANGGNYRKSIQQVWQEGKDAPYLNNIGVGVSKGVYDVANVIPSIASAFTGGVVGDDTREFLNNQSKGWSAAGEFVTDAGVAGGASRTGLGVTQGIASAVPQVLFQLGAAKGAQSLSAAGSRNLSADVISNVGFGTSVGMSGAQSFSGSYNEALGRGLNRSDALHAATLSGTITALTTAGFGKTGIESIFENPGARAGMKEYFGSIMAEASQEGLEEFTDEFFNGLVASANYGENRDPSKVIGDALTAASVGFIMGGATRTIHGRGHDHETAPVDPPQADLTPVPDFNYDFNSETITDAKGKVDLNKDRIVTENGKFSVADEAFPQTFGSREEAEQFARTRHWNRFQERVAGEFGDPKDPQIAAAVETVGRVADGLARQGINPDKEFFANILTEQDVRETLDRGRADTEKKMAARQVDEAKMSEEAAAAQEAPKEDNSRTRIADQPEELYRALVDTPPREGRFREIKDDTGIKVNELSDRVAQLRAKDNLTEAEQGELENTESLLSNAILEENDAERASGDASVTRADVAPDQQRELGPSVDEAFTRAQVDSLKKDQAKLQQKYDKLKNKESPQAKKLEEQLVDLESRIQAPDESRRVNQPVQPSASPTVDVERTVEAKIQDTHKGIQSLLALADLNAAKLGLEPQGYAGRENGVKFFDRKGNYKEVTEAIRETGALDPEDITKLESLGDEMTAAVTDWVATKPGRPMRQITNPSTELDQSTAPAAEPGERRGSTSELPRGIAGANKVLIKGFQSGDPTTLLHETFHALQLIRGADGKSILDTALGGDLPGFNKWITKGGAISPASTEALERGAVGFEQYLLTGRAPAPQLKRVFSKLANIFKSVYGGLRNLLLSTPEESGGGFDLDENAIRAYDRLFTGVGPNGVTPTKEISPEGRQPEPGPLASVQHDVRFKLSNGGIMIPTAAGAPQQGFSDAKKARAFRSKASDRLGVQIGSMAIDKVDGKYFVFAHPVTNPKLFGNTATGNTGELADLSQGPVRLWSNGEFSIERDPHPQSYALGWAAHRMMLKKGDEVVGRLDLYENPSNRGWYEVALANIEPAYRGKKLGTELYKQALATIPYGIKGISSDISLRTNKTQVPAIYKALNGFERDGFAYIPKPENSATVVPDASRLKTGAAFAQGSTVRVDGMAEDIRDPRQVRIEFSNRGRSQSISAMLDEAEDLRHVVHEIGDPVMEGETGLQPDGAYNAMFMSGKLRDSIPWGDFKEQADKAGLPNFSYNEDTGEVTMYQLEGEDFNNKANQLVQSINENRPILGKLRGEVRKITVHDPEASDDSASRAALGEGSEKLSRAQVQALSDAGRWARSMTPQHESDPLVQEAYAALDKELPGVPVRPQENIVDNESLVKGLSKAATSPLARWALASRLRGGRSSGKPVAGLLPLRLAATGDPVVDSSLEGLAQQLRSTSRGDYVTMGSAASATDNLAKAIEPKDNESQDEISLAQSERFSRELDRIRVLNQISIPKLLAHDKEKRVSSLPTGAANFFWTPIAKLLGGSKFSPWRQVVRALADNPLAPVIGTWWRYRDVAKRASYKVSREMFNKYGDIWDIDMETGNIVNFTGPVSAARSRHYVDVFEAEMEKPGSYPITQKQREWIADSRGIIQDSVKQMLAEGIPMEVFQDANGNIDYNKVASNFYFPRRVVGSIDLSDQAARSDRTNRNGGGSSGPTGKRGFDRSRKYDSAFEGSNDGIVYDPDPLSALEGFVRDTYSKIGDWRTIHDPDLAGSTNIASVKRGTRVVKVGDIQAVFDEPTANDLENYTTKKQQEWDVLKIFKNGLGAVRALKLGIDFSAPIVQGAIITVTHPLSSAKAQIAAWSAFAGPNGGREFFLKREPHIKEYVEAGGALGSALDFTEVAIEIGKQIKDKSARLGRLMDATVGRFNRFHSTFMDAAAIEYWGSLRKYAVDPATGQIDPQRAREVALQVDRLVGRESISAYGFSKNGLNAAALFATAPSMYVAYGNLMGSLFSKNPTEAKIAWQELSKFAAGGTLWFIGTALAAGMQWPEITERLKPWNSKFLTVQAKMPGSDDLYEFGAGGFFRSVTRMLGQLSNLAFDNRKNTSEDVLGPLQAFAGARVAPGVSALLSVIRGVDYYGSPKDRARLVVEGIAPIAFTDLAAAAAEKISNIFGVHGQFMTKQEKQFMDSTPMNALIQVVGLNTYPVSKRAQWYQESKEQAQKLFSKDYDKLDPIERVVVVQVNSALKGSPPALDQFDLDNFLRRKSERVAEYLGGDAKRVLADADLLDKGIAGPQAYKTPNNVSVPMTKDEQIAMEKEFARSLQSILPQLEQLKEALPEGDYKKIIRDSIKAAEDAAMARAGWPQ